MYTKLDDIKMGKKIMDYIEKNPTANRQEVMKHCFTNTKRIKKLEAEGYISLPPMPRELRNKKYYEDKAIQSSGS